MSNKRVTRFFNYLELSQRCSYRRGFSDWTQQEIRHRQCVQGSFTVKALTILFSHFIFIWSCCWTDLHEKQMIVGNGHIFRNVQNSRGCCETHPVVVTRELAQPASLFVPPCCFVVRFHGILM